MNVERFTVSMPTDDAQALRAAAEAAGTTLSNYVTQAVRLRISREEWLTRWRDLAGEPDPDALAHWHRQLGDDRAAAHSRAS